MTTHKTIAHWNTDKTIASETPVLDVWITCENGHTAESTAYAELMVIDKIELKIGAIMYNSSYDFCDDCEEFETIARTDASKLTADEAVIQSIHNELSNENADVLKYAEHIGKRSDAYTDSELTESFDWLNAKNEFYS